MLEVILHTQPSTYAAFAQNNTQMQIMHSTNLCLRHSSSSSDIHDGQYATFLQAKSALVKTVMQYAVAGVPLCKC